MLDKYLEIQVREQEKVASRDHFVERLMLLPNEELHHIQQTGEIKLAYYSDLISDTPDRKTWLDHFKGTPLYAQAIALEEEDLKAQAADDQSRVVEDQERAQKNQARDALRLEKRLLELELVKSEQAAESAAMPPPEPSPGMGAPPDMAAQGAGAPGDVPPTDVGKLAALFKTAAEKHDKAHDLGEFAGKHLHQGAAIYGASEGAKKYHGTAKSLGLGRKGRLAGAALGAVAGGTVGHAAGRLAQGAAHGAANAKGKEKDAGVGDFLRSAAPVVGDFVKKHPGAAIGGGLGALHGLMHQGGGLGSAVLEGAGGAALGHGAEHMYRSGSLKGIKDAVMPPTGAVAKEAAALPPFSDEKRAFIGAMLGALGGAAARGGMGAAASGALGAGAKGMMSGGLSGLAGQGMNWLKSNPMKAVGGAMNAASNFASARQQGQGLGSSALSGLAGGASALG